MHQTTALLILFSFIALIASSCAPRRYEECTPVYYGNYDGSTSYYGNEPPVLPPHGDSCCNEPGYCARPYLWEHY